MLRPASLRAAGRVPNRTNHATQTGTTAERLSAAAAKFHSNGWPGYMALQKGNGALCWQEANPK